jgi:hypothetical protein
MVEPVLMYWSGIWGTKSFNVKNSVQNKACKYFLSVGKNTSNNTRRYGLVYQKLNVICAGFTKSDLKNNQYIVNPPPLPIETY